MKKGDIGVLPGSGSGSGGVSVGTDINEKD